jgi:hypothetical protein
MESPTSQKAIGRLKRLVAFLLWARLVQFRQGKETHQNGHDIMLRVHL